DRNRSHWSTSKTPSYTKSVSWQHHRLIRLRKKHPQWCEASIQWKDVEHPTVIAYQRDNITFFLNNSEDTANFIYDGRSMEISGFSYEIEGLPAADLYDF
ncbi:hypothetical protein N6O42_18655, partial [Escherichia coli]|nr:hypothetical protein [Escherichia coli]